MMLKIIITWTISIIVVLNQYATATLTNTTASEALIQEKNCPLLFHYDYETRQCECLSGLFGTSVMCANDRAHLRYSYCLTYSEEINMLSASLCPYFELIGHNTSVTNYIGLPDNISELNNYMCGLMNRKGIVCSECIDGYGPSVTSVKFRCSDCSNAWYGVPLYLLLELVPVTVFYFIVLIFQVNITSAPMITFIYYSNSILLYLNFILSEDHPQAYETILVLIYSIWTLDFFRYAIPPFCVSPRLKIVHVLYLQNISTLFPYVLIAFTWLCIELYSRDYKIATWPWQLLNRMIFKHINMKWNAGRTVVDTFATFFLLSFSKVSFILLLPLYPLMIHNVNTTDFSPSVTVKSFTDLSVSFVSQEHLPFAAISIVLIFLFVLFPPVLLALYPFQRFRNILFKCLPKRSRGHLNIFVEKFYNCYRDGLDGGIDMRSLAALNFFILLFSYILSINEAIDITMPVLFFGCSLFIAIIQPYKKRYMSVIDSLIFANLALLYAFPFCRTFKIILRLIPALGLYSFVVYKLLKRPFKIIFASIKQKLLPVKQSLLTCCCNGHKDDRAQDEEQRNTENNHDQAQLPDRVVHPELYDVQEDQPTY